jgi:hypothetical protein
MSNNHPAAHSVLEYLITKATLDGESRKAIVKIPYWELAKSIGKVIENSDYDIVDLKVEINVSWAEGDGGDTSVEMSEEDGSEFHE